MSTLTTENASSSSSSCSSDIQSSSRSSSPDLFWFLDMTDDRSSTYSSSTQPNEEIAEEDWISSYDADTSSSIHACPPPSRSSTPDVDWILEVIGEPGSSTLLPDDWTDVWWKYGDMFERCGGLARKRKFDGNNFLEREGLWRTFSDLGIPDENDPEGEAHKPQTQKSPRLICVTDTDLKDPKSDNKLAANGTHISGPKEKSFVSSQDDRDR